MIKRHWIPAFIGVGSNLESPVDQIRRAVTSIQDLPESILVSESGLYRSAPLGPQEQPDFVNAVVAILTQLNSIELLALLQKIESLQGRDRKGERWGPRTLDLDLLAFGNELMDSDQLKLPHPGIAERNFVLLPWNEIAPQYRVPGLAMVRDLAAGVSSSEPPIEKIS